MSYIKDQKYNKKPILQYWSYIYFIIL